MENKNNWEGFWRNEFRIKEVENEDDLYFQVGKTLNKKPIEKEVFDKLTKNIIDKLQLTTDDVLLEMCCGNGLCTYELKDNAKQIIAVDFAPHLIESAKKYKAADNISYTLASVFDFLKDFKSNFDVIPLKYLMNDAISNFEPENLRQVLESVIEISGGKFIFLITGAPNDDLKWNFYNTEERKQRYIDNNAKGDTRNDGVGRWWTPQEIKELCESLNLDVAVENLPEDVSNFRMDFLISSK